MFFPSIFKKPYEMTGFFEIQCVLYARGQLIRMESFTVVKLIEVEKQSKYRMRQSSRTIKVCDTVIEVIELFVIKSIEIVKLYNNQINRRSKF